MPRRPARGRTSPIRACESESIVRHGSFPGKTGRRTRFRCRTCGRTFSTKAGTAYEGIQRTKSHFDLVASLSVEGVNKFAIARSQSRRVQRAGYWRYQQFGEYWT